MYTAERRFFGSILGVGHSALLEMAQRLVVSDQIIYSLGESGQHGTPGRFYHDHVDRRGRLFDIRIVVQHV